MTGQKTAALSHFTLANGMDVLVIPDHRAPVVTHMVYYRNGAADDPHGKSGIAHFLEHLMFKGTAKYPKGVFSDIVSELGGQENAFTGHDYTAYFQRVAKEHLAKVMELEADRMNGLVLDEAEVASERDVILEERKMHVDADPAAQLYESLSAALYTHHPYGTPIIGWEHEIEGLGRDDALAYYKRFYTPENAILIVAGDVEGDTVRTLAEASYGAVKRRNEPPQRKRPQEPPPRAERLVTLADEKVEQPTVYRLYLAPSHATAEGSDAYALEVLSQILAGSSAGIAYRQLVVEKQKAVTVSSWYRNDALDQGTFGLYAVPADGVSLAELDGEIDAIIAGIAEHGVEEAVLRRARTRLVADMIYAQDSQAQLARMYGAALCTGGSVEDVRGWPAKIAEVTIANIKHVAGRYLQRRLAAVGHLKKAA
ncbi:MAG TPA: pitrilysin family protein [Beijerinckiaceae bacterium]|nr:pitrilysin family protein [Beijerinckiaceae bacterium]